MQTAERRTRYTNRSCQKASNFLKCDVEVHLGPGPVCYSALLHFMDDLFCLTLTKETCMRRTGDGQGQRGAG